MSGASLKRSGFQSLMRAAATGTFDVVVAESLERFSRDEEDTAGLVKRLMFAGVRIVTLSEGDIGPLHVGLNGTMNALYLLQLAEKSTVGSGVALSRTVWRGGSAMAIVWCHAPEGQPRGERQIHLAEAVIVQRIFPTSSPAPLPRRSEKD